MAFVNVGIIDAFGNENRIRLQQTGQGKAGWGVKLGRPYLPVALVSFDGARLRIAYEYSKGISATVLYLHRPYRFYSLGKLISGPPTLRPENASRFYQVTSVQPLRELEMSLIRLGNNYEHGRVGAEIAGAVLTQKFGCPDVILAEPARGGKDLYSKDKSVVVQSRLLVYLPESWWRAEIQRQLKQMVRKLKVDFSYTSQAKLGYAVLSFIREGRIKALIAEVRRHEP